MDSFFISHKPELEKAVEHTQSEISSIRTGRANPVVLENIMVESYGTKTPLKQLASISVPEARCMVVQPWDKSVIKDIEKAITQANLGMQVVNEGNLLRVTVPQLTEESRQELVKLLKEKLEKGRIAVRQLRDKIKEEIVTKERGGELTEDDRFKLQKELDELTNEYNGKIKELGEKKEAEITTV